MLHNVNFKKVKSYFLAVLFIALFSTNVFAQEVKPVKAKLSEGAIKSLNMGIKSENTGIKKHAIYFAGLYLIDESVETLLDQLEEEQDPEVRMLITKALYLIDNGEYMSEIKDLAYNDKDENVRELAHKLYPVIQMELN